jgi:outer membrane protein TolC
MQKLMIKIFLVSACISASNLFAQDEKKAGDEILSLFNRMYPAKSAVFREVGIGELDYIINSFVKISPSVNQMQAQISNLDLQILMNENSYFPTFNMSLGYQGYTSYERMVDVMAVVPTKFSTTDYVKTDYNLPDGGHGIIWVPRPLEYGERDISLHAMWGYLDKFYSYNIGMNYITPWGLSIDALNLSTGYRVLPNTYGYSWISSFTNSFTLPLFKNFGVSGSAAELERKNSQININITKINLDQTINNIAYQAINNYIDLYFLWKNLLFFNDLIFLTREQLDDTEVLANKDFITTYEKIALEKEYRQLTNQKEIYLIQYISLSSKLNEKSFSSGLDFYLFRPVIDSVDFLIKDLERQVSEYYGSSSFNIFLQDNSQYLITKNYLEQSRLNLTYVTNQHKPDFFISGLFSLSQSSTLGFKTPGQSLNNLVSNPDAIVFNLSLNYMFDFAGRYKDLALITAQNEYQQNEYQLQLLKEQLEREMSDFIFRVKSQRFIVENTKLNYDAAKEMELRGNALYNIKRISRYDYNSYLKESINQEMNLLSQKQAYIKLLLQCSQFLNHRYTKVLGPND